MKQPHAIIWSLLRAWVPETLLQKNLTLTHLAIVKQFRLWMDWGGDRGNIEFPDVCAFTKVVSGHRSVPSRTFGEGADLPGPLEPSNETYSQNRLDISGSNETVQNALAPIVKFWWIL